MSFARVARAASLRLPGQLDEPTTLTQTAVPGVVSSSRVSGLDLLRAVAVLAVMADHFVRSLPGTVGWVGVDLFFVLSGYLITGVLLDSRGAPGWRRTFYVRRILRIWPLYYAVLAVMFLTVDRSSIAGWEWTYWLHLSNWAMGLEAQNAALVFMPLWSLAIEEQFYAFWPFAVGSLNRRMLARLCIGLLGLSFMFRVALVLNGAVPVTVYMLTPGRLDGLVLGSLLAITMRAHNGVALARRLGWMALGLAGPALAALVIYQRGLPWDSGLSLTLGILLVSVLFAGVLAVTRGGQAIRTHGIGRPLCAVGVRSYGLYLLHLPVWLALFALALPIPQHVLGLVAAVASFGVAAISWRFFESPILRLKSLVPYARATTAS